MDGEPPFQPRFPWWNGDLQTLRDTFRSDALPPDQGQLLPLDVGGGEQLLAKLDAPFSRPEPLGLVLLMHGLGDPANVADCGGWEIPFSAQALPCSG